MADWNDDLILALHLANIADSITKTRFVESISWERKQDGSPVSEVDCAVEEAVAVEIRLARPNDRIIGEELNTDRISIPLVDYEKRQWIIDPIDQTRHYVRGNPEFATLIALTQNDQVVVGVVSAPALGHRWWAAHGQGAWKNGHRITVSRTAELEDAYLVMAGHREWHTRWQWSEIVRLLDRCTYPTGCHGGFLQQMLIAEGAIDIFLEPWGEIWDHAGPSLIVEEAGGRVTTLTGFPPRGGSLLATNGTLHQEALQYLIPK